MLPLWWRRWFGDSDADIWHADLKPHASGEFSIAVAQANSCLEDQSEVLTSPSATYIGVYDGHGGPEASRFVSKRVLPYLQKLVSEEGCVSVDVIKKALSVTEEEFLHSVKKSLGRNPDIGWAGSCCLVGAICNNVLYIANLGDSRAVLGKRVNSNKKKVMVQAQAQRLTVDHNVCVEEVRREVKALHPHDSRIVVNTHGVWRIKGIIQVSRAIGDVYLKKPGLGNPLHLRRPVLSAEPAIIVREVDPQDWFLIFASDGLWEQLTDQAAVDIVSKHPRLGIAKRLVRAALQVAANKSNITYHDIKKLHKGNRRNFHDDITVIVIYLDHHNGSSPSKRTFTHNALASTTAPLNIFSSNQDHHPMPPTVA
ncbi:hypothetical protein VNO77_41695 [Canavalia gladiata]|uniref:protein-serine/threonine phosphatase n=1 Tax=Canavalia gladiata TaxID=3824 RepID=A0AAN9JZC8_CANGL